MIVGVTDPAGATPVAVSDTLVTRELDVPPGNLVKLTAWMDGQGALSGSQAARVVLYRPGTNRLVAQGPLVQLFEVGDTRDAGWVDVPLPGVRWEGGPLIVGLFLGEAPGRPYVVGASGGQTVEHTSAPAAGAPDQLAAGSAAGVLAAFVTVGAAWDPPRIPDDELAALGWPSAQRALSGGVLSATARRVGCEWHGTLLDERRGAFALVREGGPLEELVGERLRVTRGRRTVYVYVVDSSTELDEDLSLTRRGFAVLANLSRERIDVVTAVVGASS